MRGASIALTLVGVFVPYACGGTAVIDPPDDDGTGGAGGDTTTTNGTTTSTSVATSTATSTATSATSATSTAVSSGSGGGGCIGCGDYIAGQSTNPEQLCGFVDFDPGNGQITCQPNTSCQLLQDLQTCACTDCAADCAGACNGQPASNQCLNCITTTCNMEFNACAGDVQ